MRHSWGFYIQQKTIKCKLGSIPSINDMVNLSSGLHTCVLVFRVDMVFMDHLEILLSSNGIIAGLAM